MIEPRGSGGAGAAWVSAFHEGGRAVMSELYRDYFAAVEAAVGHVLSGADQETVIHEVFFKLISSSEQRRRFRGGSFGAWIRTVARNQAIDHARRLGRERTMPSDKVERYMAASTGVDEDASARVLIERFRAELPDGWRAVFDLCFLAQLPQRDAAERLGIARTTLAYQYHRVRRRLRQFLVPRKDPS
jgi:RNA polymerase sigma-70 factor (ECF subfamily)